MNDILNQPITTGQTTPTEQPSWLDQINDPEIKGHIQTKGWHQLDPAQVAIEAIKAHRGVEKLMGAPADQLLRLPRVDDPEGTKAFWARLGAVEKPEEITLSNIAFDDPAWQTGFTDAVRKAAIENHVPKEMAEKIAESVFRFAEGKGAESEAAASAQLEADRQELVREWGPPEGARFKAAMFVADKALDALGVTPEQQQQLADTMGRMAVAKLFHKIGSAMQEDRFVSGAAPASSSGIMTREQAISRRAELIADADFRSRFDRGDPNARKELDALIHIISGV
jgi:hypothetical protein